MSPTISVFTPAHDPSWLDQAYTSLLMQDFDDWEWVVLLNNGAEWPTPVDSRVRVVKYPGVSASVGHLKGVTVGFCRGDIFVELDADDLFLTSDLLTNIAQALQDSEVGLAYSDFTQVNEDLSPNLEEFRADHGWVYHGYIVQGPFGEGREYRVPYEMAPTPHNVSYIWYAPNHVRSFSRVAYEKVGGYSTMEVCDDLDLMNRLYQYGRFVKVPGLYGQRIHSHNTQKHAETNARIQELTVQLYEQNVAQNLLAWSQRQGLRALELGGGNAPSEGFESVDMFAPADIVHKFPAKLEKVKDGTVGVIRAVDFLEHVADKIKMMDEIWRMLAPNGMLLSLTPSTDGRGAFQDPTHVSYWNENSFWYWTNEEMIHHSRQNKAAKARFQVSKVATFYPTQWHADHHISYVQANLIAVKSGYTREGGILNVGYTNVEERISNSPLMNE